MKTLKVLFVFIFFFIFADSVNAGYGSGRYYNNFKYKVDGEIAVKPDIASYPVIVTIDSRSYKRSLSSAKRIISGISKDLKKLGKNEYSISTTNFFRSKKYSKIKVTFFGGNKEKRRTKMIFNINVNFKDTHDFWKRAALIAEILDFIKSAQRRYSNDTIKISQGERYFHINNVEKFRKDIISSIYKKAKTTASVIETNEKRKLKIVHITFGQNIKKSFLGFDKATLSLDANIEFAPLK